MNYGHHQWFNGILDLLSKEVQSSFRDKYNPFVSAVRRASPLQCCMVLMFMSLSSLEGRQYLGKFLYIASSSS